MAVDTGTNVSPDRDTIGHSQYRYHVYGIVVRSDTPLALPESVEDGLGEVECVRAPADVFLSAMRGVSFDQRSDSWYQYACLRDGSTYVRWNGVGEFLVTCDGLRIMCRPEDGSSLESFQVYMLGQALSFALVKQHLEPLHATVVVVDGRAVAFLGSHAYGKSTLAACFLEAGHQLLTDDLFVIAQSHHQTLAYPGPARIKLFPKIARRFLGHIAGSARMNEDTEKLILPLDEYLTCASPVTLAAIYSLSTPRDACRTLDVSIEPLSPRAAFVELISATFNRRLVSPQRLARQFDTMARLADRVPVMKLSYPRSLERLQDVRDSVLANL
jgi:hypothetical protein